VKSSWGDVTALGNRDLSGEGHQAPDQIGKLVPALSRHIRTCSDWNGELSYVLSSGRFS
jgi:hypothetical protein